MLLPFKLYAGGPIGGGKQYWSCISLVDLTAALRHCVTTNSLHGPVNLVNPNPVTNAEFTKELGAALNRPTFLPMPAFAARLALGEMADALILTSTRASSRHLQDSGFTFQHPTVTEALACALGAQQSSKSS